MPHAEWAHTVDGWLSLLTISLLGILLNVDNLVVLAVVSGRLAEPRRTLAQRIGLAGALGLRIAMLFLLTWLKRLSQPVIVLPWITFSWRDLTLLAGGTYLILKAVGEMHGRKGTGRHPRPEGMLRVIAAIMVLDFVFSLDSTMASVTLTRHLPVMILANVISVTAMLAAAKPFTALLEHHPSLRIMAMTFVLVIGAALVADGLHHEIPRGYLYVIVLSALAAEVVRSLARRRKGRNGGL